MDEQRYRFGPLERRGLLVGLTLGQLTALTVGALLAIAATAEAPDALGIAVAVTALGLAAAAAFVPVGGQTAVGWMPTVVSSLLRSLRHGRVNISTEPLSGHAIDGGERPSDSPPPPLRGCSVASARGETGEEIGVVVDRLAQTITACIAVRGTGFALLDDHDRARRLAAWGSLLDWLCRDGSRVHRLQWCEHSHPTAGSSRDEASPVDDAVAAAHAELLDGIAGTSQRHECLLAITVSTRRGHRSLRSVRGDDPVGEAFKVLRRELRPLVERLRACDLDCLTVLDRTALIRSLRRRTAAEPDLITAGTGAGSPWPLATVTTWSNYRADATWHATFWIAEWPRTDVGPDFLAPLLLQTSVRRTVSVTMSFDSPAQAQREAEAALTADLADDDLRQRAGFLTGFRRRREQESVLRRGEEIAAGHGAVRFSGYVTVTAADADALEAACAEVEQQAQQAHLEVRRLFGQQDTAFAMTLPLGRGLR